MKIDGPQVEEFLHARAGVEEREKEGMVTATLASPGVCGRKHRAELLALQVLDYTNARALERHREDTLARGQVLRSVRRGVAGECMEGGEADVAGRRAVSAAFLEVFEERNDGAGVEVVEVEFDDGPVPLLSKKAKEERNRIAVAEHRVATQTADARQMVCEETTEHSGKRVGLCAAHRSSSSPSPRTKGSQ